MNWLDRMNQAMDYIENHLNEEISSDELARIACCSSYHFQRMFGYMADMTLSEYIRRRRMAMAAVDLTAGMSVTDAAAKYGYESPTSFNRAFQNMHGIAPSKVHEEGANVKAFPRLRFHLTLSGGTELNYRIERRDQFTIVGLSEPLSERLEDNFVAVPRLWQRVAQEGCIERMIGLNDRPPHGLLGVSLCHENSWKYVIGVASDLPAPGLDRFDIDSFMWAVFPGEGTCPEAIQNLERRVVTEWLPTSGYEYANGPDLEVYLSPDPRQAQFEVWIPVIKQTNMAE